MSLSKVNLKSRQVKTHWESDSLRLRNERSWEENQERKGETILTNVRKEIWKWQQNCLGK